jgi:hypothetical protein
MHWPSKDRRLWLEDRHVRLCSQSKQGNDTVTIGVSGMAKDIEQELDAIFAQHNARVAQARSEVAGKTAATDDFLQAAAVCMTGVITPALQQMARALNERGVAARVPADGSDVRIDIPVSKHVRIGHGFGGYPYLRARPDRNSRRIHFERNTSDSRGSSAVGDYPIADVNAELVREMVMELVRALYGPF